MGDHADQPHLKLELLSQARFLAAVRALVCNVAQRLGFDEMGCGQISLAVDEALCNVINHGYERRSDGHIWLSIWAIDSPPERTPGMKIVIEDRARQVEPEFIRSRDLDDIRPGGLGVYIIREIMDEVNYEKREGGGMRLTLFKNAPPARTADGPQAKPAACARPSRIEAKHE